MLMYIDNLKQYFSKKAYNTARIILRQKLLNRMSVKLEESDSYILKGTIKDEHIQVNLKDVFKGKYKNNPLAYNEAVLCLEMNLKIGYQISAFFLDDYRCEDMATIFLNLLLKHPEMVRDIPNSGEFALALMKLLKDHPELVDQYANDTFFVQELYVLLAVYPELINEISHDDQTLISLIRELNYPLVENLVIN